MSLDETDRRIIEVLQRDASIPYKEVARKLAMNESTVRKRVLALKERGVVKFTVLVEPGALGYTESLLGVDTEPSRIIEVGRQLAGMKDVRMLFSTSGDYDFCVIVWTSDRESLSKVIQEVSGLAGVKRVSPSMVIEKLKGPPPTVLPQP